MSRTIKINTVDKNFSRLVKFERGWRCERCKKSYPVGHRGLHCSHFIGRANKQVRWDRRNVDVLCYGCHQYLETRKAIDYREWKIDKLGKEEFGKLVDKSRELETITNNYQKELSKKFAKELREYE